MRPAQALAAFFRDFRDEAPLTPGDRIVVAFSGGTDSLALLAELARFMGSGARPARQAGAGSGCVVAAHLDHGLDAGSAARARAAAALAGGLGVEFVAARREVGSLRRPGEALEAAARRERYDFLETVRVLRRARYVATAHHRDDQAETVVLRLLFGTAIDGLAGIRPVVGALIRPLLACGRQELAAAVAAAGLTGLADPSNQDLRRPRNRIRHLLLPALAGSGAVVPAATTVPAAGDDGLPVRLARLAERAAAARDALDRRLAELVRCGDLPAGAWGAEGARGAEGPRGRRGATAELAALLRLPPPLLERALAMLHRRAGAPYPAGRKAAAELISQLLEGRRVGCDCGKGWRWAVSGRSLVLQRALPERSLEMEGGQPAGGPPQILRPGPSSSPPGLQPPPLRGAPRGPWRETAPLFTYTLQVPGELHIPEIQARLRVQRSPVRAWMFTGAPRRAGLALPLAAEGRSGEVTIRSRRPGDRLQPLGSPGRRRLKDLLIERGVPGQARGMLPLLCVGELVAWVPGITIDERVRIGHEPDVWLAEILAGPDWLAELLENLAYGNPHRCRPVEQGQGLCVPAGRHPEALPGASGEVA